MKSAPFLCRAFLCCVTVVLYATTLNVVLYTREAHNRRQAAVFNAKADFFSSPQATPPEVQYLI